jgi:hypothetical protein
VNHGFENETEYLDNPCHLDGSNPVVPYPVRIPKLVRDVFSDHPRSYSAGNIRVLSGSTSSQIMLKKPEVGTEWALE